MRGSRYIDSRTEAWSIDPKTGHCAHPLGIVTYFCDHPTPSGAIRCVGPFIQEGLMDSQIAGEMRNLCKLLESASYFPDNYLVFGAYQEEPDFREHEFPLLTSIVGFIPCLALRNQILCDDVSWKKEWSAIDSIQAKHRSGISFGNAAQNEIDIEVVHPTTFNQDLETLQERALKSGLKLKGRATKTPLVWTPTTLAG